MTDTVKYVPQLRLDAARARKLIMMRSTPGYEVLKEIGDALCTIRETRLLQMDRSGDATSEQILSAHDQARAARASFSDLQLEIEAQAAVFLQEQEKEHAQRGDAPEGSEDGESIS